MTRFRLITILTISCVVLAGCKAKPSTSALKPAPLPATIYPAASPCTAGPTTTAANPLPDLTLPCFTGAKGELNLRTIAGKPTLVTLWASWCGPCLKELPAMQRVYAKGKVSVVGINTENDASAGVSLLNDLKITFPSVWDFAGRTLDRLPNVRRALPVTVFLDDTGEVRKVYQSVGFDDTTLASALHDYLGVA